MCVYYIKYNYLRGNIYWGSSASDVNQFVRITVPDMSMSGVVSIIHKHSKASWKHLKKATGQFFYGSYVHNSEGIFKFKVQMGSINCVAKVKKPHTSKLKLMITITDK